MKTFIFDLESNGFLEKMDRIHCLVIVDFHTEEVFRYGPTEIEAGLKKLQEADILVGHNILAFDIPAIKKIYPKVSFKAELRDTLVYTRVVWSDIKEQDFALLRKGKISAGNIGRHSLESWGERMGELKGDYGKTTDWAEFEPKMLDYCEQDTKVNCKLYAKILSKECPQSVLDMEQRIHEICLDQERFGFPFNERKAEILLAKLLVRKAELYSSLCKQLGPSWIMNIGNKVSSRTVKYKLPDRANEFKDSEWTKVKVVEFNPNSRAHLAKRLVEVYGWKPKEFGDDDVPKLDDDILSKLKFPVAPEISEFLMLQKRLGQLAEGQQAWLSCVGDDSRIHGRVNTMGAVTARASHSKPNLAQIPSNSSPYGKECRALFEAPKGMKLFGTDASGLELRMLAHYMAAYDGGEYGRLILEGDVHTANQIAAGLPTRNAAKTFIYGFLYGAGDLKLAEIINGTKAQGKKLKEKFLNNTPALKSLREAVAQKVLRTGTLKALDGRILPVRHAHAAVNTLLQSAGAIVCKQWTVYIHDLLLADGYKLGIDYAQLAWVHDELQIAYDPAKLTNEYLLSVSKKAMIMVTDKFKLRIPVDAEGNSGDNYSETH